MKLKKFLKSFIISIISIVLGGVSGFLIKDLFNMMFVPEVDGTINLDELKLGNQYSVENLNVEIIDCPLDVCYVETENDDILQYKDGLIYTIGVGKGVLDIVKPITYGGGRVSFEFEITFNNEYVKEAVLYMLNKQEDDYISSLALDSITYLQIDFPSNTYLKDYKDLTVLKSLESLKLNNIVTQFVVYDVSKYEEDFSSIYYFDLADFPYLKELTFDVCKIDYIDFIHNDENLLLETLNLFNVECANLVLDSLANTLKVLILDNYESDNYDVNFFKELNFKKLEYVEIISSKFKNLNIDSTFEKLSYLKISSSEIDNININSSLDYLTELLIVNNELSNLNFNKESSFASLEKLEILNIASKYINFNNGAFFPILKELKIEGTFNGSVVNLKLNSEMNNLVKLNLSRLNMDLFDFKLDLENLKELTLNDFAKTINFESKLGIDSFEFSSTYETIINFKENAVIYNLKDLSIDNSKINSIQLSSALSNLESISLKDNSLKTFTIISPLNNLKSLNLENNLLESFESLEAYLPVLKELKLSNNHISTFNASSNYLSLEYLDLSNNVISDTSFLNSEYFIKLKEINLSYNYISEINIYREVKSLEKLIANNNIYLGFIVLNKFTVPSLKEIDLSSCNISTFQVFNGESITSIEKINLSSNQLTSLNLSYELSNLTYLNISSNYIEDSSLVINETTLNQLEIIK